MTPRAVLMKTGLKAVNTARPATRPISQTSWNLIEDMLPLGEEPDEEELLMCDKKNSVLFTDTAYFVLSSDFKLPDESQILLKATLDESMLWHTRLGHINFKTINKLVKDNLVRGLPAKHFENDQTCVACLKGKKHKASCKSKIQNSVTQPLFILHMDLFGPTFNRVIIVKPHNKTPYELFRCRTPALSFMRPFGCHVTILNTLDHLCKFDGKSDDGFFVGYSLTSDGPKWLFDIDSLTKSMNYVPVIASTNSNDFAASEESNGAGHTSKETKVSQDYIMMPLGGR
ncbi:ribonuclease H-like domain-containing protein [Tanacetum coccineum]|uniref:Ribonuclease H-like domain-containing protein n=1 Tax=Tanacetum coccineum TaxID=301880 RepID=A0ABQ4ZZ43_9ASTR